MVVDALAGLKDDLTGRYYSLTQMTEKEQQQLIDVSDAGELRAFKDVQSFDNFTISAVLIKEIKRYCLLKGLNSNT